MLERKLLFCININATTLTEALMSMMMTFTFTISHNDNAADDGDNWEDDDDGDVNHDFCYGRTYVRNTADWALLLSAFTVGGNREAPLSVV